MLVLEEKMNQRERKIVMKVAIIGANGNVGTRLGQLLAQRGDQPVGYIRNEEQAHDLEELNKAMELINYKCKYYMTALDAGTEDIHKNNEIGDF